MSSLLSNIIRKLEETNLQQEKLAVLRKMQKEKEKKQILSERIETESHSNAANAVNQAQVIGGIIIKDAKNFNISSGE